MKRNVIISTVLGLFAITLSAANVSTVALNDRFEESHKENLNALNDSPSERLHQRFEAAHQETRNS